MFAKAEMERVELKENQVPELNQLYQPRKVVKVVNNLNFEVEQDRPIVKEGGIIKPMDFEYYINYKLDQLEERLVVLEEKIHRLETKLNN